MMVIGTAKSPDALFFKDDWQMGFLKVLAWFPTCGSGGRAENLELLWRAILTDWGLDKDSINRDGYWFYLCKFLYYLLHCEGAKERDFYH